ncbi:MAG: decaprenyl-phosphate phosphoribosyltransferase [Chloroflexi bacterium]|nr:decaprenyl-phosphate phosphoribosyltransferase [Chloroflexota bacterium]
MGRTPPREGSTSSSGLEAQRAREETIPAFAATRLETLLLIAGSVRPRQWTKNLLLAFPFFFSVGERWSLQEVRLGAELFLTSLYAVLAFCALSGAVYMFNDIIDRSQDRQHPTKRSRPIASGRLPVSWAAGGSAILAAAALSAGFYLSVLLGMLMLVYAAINLSYSSFLKRVVLLDVFVLSSGYVLRLVAGSVLIDVATSPWLYTTIGLGALFIVLGKRYSELVHANGNATIQRTVLELYTPALLGQLLVITASFTLVAYSLYTFTAPNLPSNHLMMVTLVFVLFGMFRYLYLVHSRQAGETPETTIISDTPLLLTILGWGLTTALLLAFQR